MMDKHNPIFLKFMVTCCCLVNLLGGILAQTEKESNIVVKVGAVIDVSSNGTVGKIGLSCINMSLSDFYLSHSHYKTRIQLIVMDSHRDVVTAAAHGNYYYLHPFILSLLLLYILHICSVYINVNFGMHMVLVSVHLYFLVSGFAV